MRFPAGEPQHLPGRPGVFETAEFAEAFAEFGCAGGDEGPVAAWEPEQLDDFQAGYVTNDGRQTGVRSRA
jgi:hypothetical protein